MGPESLARVIWLLLGVALFLSLANGGWGGRAGHPGVRGWLNAKFIGAK